MFFSPLADEAPPATCDACWLPGGYPELHAGTLSRATRFLDGLRAFAVHAPVHGECGGYMTLGRALVDAEGTSHAMAGLLGHVTSYARRQLHIGYRDATLLADGALGAAGRRFRGHEFHYATILQEGDACPLFATRDVIERELGNAGLRRGRVAGSFIHLIDLAC